MVSRASDWFRQALRDLEPRVYTLGELLGLARSGARIVEEVLRHGVLLAGDRGVLDELSRARRAGT